MRTLLNKYGWAILGLFGALLYAYQLIFYAITTLPNMDEGAFLLKGLSYATGRYTYYQDYGFWNTKMFFSYYLYGYIQVLFGAGLLAPRIFAVLLNLTTLFAIWIIARGRSPIWLAPLAIWIMALNTPFIKILSRANSQVVVNALLVWILFIFIRRSIRTPQLIFGSVLVALMVLTRENMVFFVLPWIVYVWWDKGFGSFKLSLMTFLVVLILGHAIFYPQILGLWLRFLPAGWVNDPVINLLSTPYNIDLQVPLFSKLISLSYGIRHYYLQLFGFFLALFFIWRSASDSTEIHELKVKIFLSTSFLFLLFPHMYASIGLEYCTFCFSTYLAFFINIAFILILLTFADWNATLTREVKFVLLSGFGLVYLILWWSNTEKSSLNLGDLPFPRIRNGQVLSEFTSLGNILANKFQLPLQTIEVILTFLLALLLVTAAGMLFTLLRNRKWILDKFSLPRILFGVLLLYHFFSTVDILEGNSCIGNVPAWYSKIGNQMRVVLPREPRIYLDGTTSALPLLYLPEASFYPPQVDNYYSFVDRVDSEFLLKNGFWNEEIKTEWLDTSNVLLIEPDMLESLQDKVDLDRYQRSDYQYSANMCSPQQEILLFIKKDG